MWFGIILLSGCSTESKQADTSVVVTPQLDQSDSCDQSDASGVPTGNVECTNGRCLVAAGPFWMGSDIDETECPVHEVTLDAFEIDQFEVTLAEWQACVNQNRCGALPTHCLNELTSRPDYTTTFPAVCVTWAQASAYCEDQGGRLPTEAEWEKAAAGTQGAKWAWGSSPPECDDANFRLASIYCWQGVRPVGWYSDSVSAFGLYDVNGNVFEWTEDWYDATFYAESPALNPIKDSGVCTSTIDAEPRACSNRVLRGGAYNTTEATIRNAARSFADPMLVDVNIGFRCAYDAP